MAKAVSKRASEGQPLPQLSESQIMAAIKLLKVLSGEVRFRVLNLLSCKAELCVTDICDELKLPQPLVSNHLGMLSMLEAVTSRREKQRIFYTITPKVKALVAAIGASV